jgi:hypothetical protein
MAESVNAKFNRYLRRDFTPAEAKGIIGFMVADKIIDVATFGTLNRLTGKAIVNTVTKLVPFALRTAAVPAASVLGSAARAAIPIATNPYLAGAALGYGALQTQPGQQLLGAAAESGADTRRSLDMALFNIQAQAEEKVKRTKSKFNRAVSAGMKAAKRGTSYGKKGIINAPKKAFKAVVSTASRINRAERDNLKLPLKPKGSNAKKIYNAILGVFR